ncbi:MAG: hypothetical protein ACJASJ_000878 [Candidatus Azotimanducaceae bacterium]
MKVGDVVKVKVMQVDVERRRIGLTMRLEDEAKNQELDIARDKPGQGPARKQTSSSNSESKAARDPRGNRDQRPDKPHGNARNKERNPPVNSAMADALAKALKQ